MRNELQEAVEYLGNQLELVRRYAEDYPDKDNYTALADIYTTALDTTLSALRDALQRQPDPDTGLVPCGCGELVAVSQYPQTPIRAVQYSISCFNCGVETRMFLSEQEAVNAWNSAMGRRGEE